MTIQTSIKLATASVIAVLMALFFVSTLSVSAHEGEEAESVETTF